MSGKEIVLIVIGAFVGYYAVSHYKATGKVL